MKILCVLLASIVFLAGSALAQSDTAERKEAGYVIAVNDILEITVYDEPDLTKTIRVGPDGNINYPLVGQIKAAGISPKDFEASLKDMLGTKYIKNPQVNVNVAEFGKVYVMGKVNRPGAYEIRSGLTVIGAIALAGGMSEIAYGNGTKVVGLRDGRKKTFVVPVNSILQGNSTARDIVLEPGDTIFVPESFF